MFERPNLLTKYIYITAYQICSCCTSSRRAIFACYRKKNEVSNITRQNSEAYYQSLMEG